MRRNSYPVMFLLSAFLLNVLALHAQQTDEETCRKEKREAGVNAQREGKYADAIRYYKAIRLCYPQSKPPPSVEDDVNGKIRECDDAIALAQRQRQEATERERVRVQEQRQRQEAAASVDIQMVLVRGGIFAMGCTSEQGNDCSSDERPVHSVTLSNFYIGKYEVTQAQWQAVMGNNPSYFKGDNLPVEQVSWNDIQEFIRKLNAQTGKTYRLPTEAEWEYAARGGAQSRGYKYSGSNTVGNVAWYSGNSGNTTHPAGQKSPNELGIYDMSGNVWEWCSDRYGAYSSSSQTNPAGPSSGSYRVFRGGSWFNGARSVRVPFRRIYTPDDRTDFLGFRLASSSKAEVAVEREKSYIISSPTYKSQHGNKLKIIEIDMDRTKTTISFCYTSPSMYINGGWVAIWGNTFIRDCKTQIKYPLVEAINIPISPKKHNFNRVGEKLYFTLVFPSLPSSTTEIDMIESENDDNTFNFREIQLR